MSISLSIVIVLLLISEILSSVGKYISTLYLINVPAYNCLSSLNYYKQSTLNKIKNKMLSVQNLYDLAIRDLNETSSHNLRRLNENNGYGCSDTIYCNCEGCAALATFTIDPKLEYNIIRKFKEMDFPEFHYIVITYESHQEDWRLKMCQIRKRHSDIMKEVDFNENEENYIHVLCDYYFSQ